MSDQLLHIILGEKGGVKSASDKLDSDSLASGKADGPDSARLLAAWNGVEAQVRKELSDVSPRETVLHGLVAAGRDADLSDEERAIVRESRERVDAAVSAYPGLADAIQSVGDDADLFDSVWLDVPGLDMTASDMIAPDVITPVSKTDRAPVPASERPPAKPSRMRLVYGWTMRTALAAVTVGFIATVVFLAQSDRGMTTAVAPANGSMVVDLGDGSSVRLVDGATLRYSEEGEDRQVELSGRGFFDVTPGHDGFTVRTENARTTVLGTSFGVEALDDLTTVTLVSGRVAVTSIRGSENMVVLEPGQRTEVREAGPASPEPADLMAELAWSDLLVFRAATMRTVARGLRTTRGVSLRVHDRFVNQTISGTFAPEQPTREILDVIATTLGARVIDLGDASFAIEPAE